MQDYIALAIGLLFALGGFGALALWAAGGSFGGAIADEENDNSR